MRGIRRFAALAAGALLLGLAATPADAFAPEPASAAPSIITDLDAPSIEWLASSLSTGSPRIYLSWSAVDAVSGVLGTDVRWRSRNLGGSFGAWQQPTAWQGLPAATEISKKLETGKVYQFQLRAHDIAGNVSRWEALGGGRLPILP